MKNTLSLLFIMTALCANSQTKSDTIWYKSNWERTTYHEAKAIYGIKDYDKNGRGLASYYYKDGALHSHQNEFNDLKDGLCTWYYPNGEKRKEAEYKNDTLNGEYKTFNLKGKLERIEVYEQGIIKETTDFDVETGLSKQKGASLMDTLDTEPEFKGGLTELQNWIAMNVQYPEESIKMNEQGKVYLSFVVEKNGETSSIIVLRGATKSLDKEAIRLVQSMPNWIPGTVNDKAVRSLVRLPINFVLTSETESGKD